jgi:hypothetical protein
MSWEQLRSIVLQNRQEHEFWAGQPPRSCPNDGTPLVTGRDGSLCCPHDGYQWPRDPALPGEGGNV